MEIRLIRMEIRNFKGIRSLDVDLGGDDIRILGANATGKTSVYDAFLWLLFDKDSSQSTKFSAKPIGPDGEEKHNLTTSVSAELSVDGEVYRLTRTMSEKWVKPRGHAEAVFAGNESAYEIDGVPKKAGEFADFRDRLVNEETFRLITSPTAFNALRWQDRRAHLLRLSGSPDELRDPKYAPVIDQIRKMGADDLKKSLQSQRRKLNSELDQIPARVDEVTALMPDVSQKQIRDAEFIVADTEQDIENVRRMISDASREPDRIRGELCDVERTIRSIEERNNAAVIRAQREEARVQALKEDYERQIKENRKIEEEARRHAEEYSQERERLVAEWKTVNSEVFPETESDHICPTCGQELPEDKVLAAREKALADWKNRQKQRLDSIRADGKRVAAARDKMLEMAEQCAERIRLLEIQKDAVVKEAAPAETPALERISEQLLARRDELKAMADLPEDSRVAGLRERMRDLNALRDKHKEVLNRRDARKLYERRIEELSERQQELGRLVAETDRNLMLVEEYVQELCRRVEEGVSARFENVRWKLYEKQINGGVVDTCVCMVNGVPYADANNAAKINAGLEIIDVFSEHIGVQAPIFVDNAEAVNQVAATRGQQIQLIVTDDPELVIRKGA